MTKDEVYRKLDDKIKDLKSTRVFKKITPKGDLSWYIKWVSSIFIILGMALTSANLFPINIIIHGIGVTGWLIVGMLWHDRALIFLNAVAIFVYATGLLNHYFGS
tara:strand:+ start:88 stop:402 length:315 start_codon:yes stop_codon:yes gene_type:complete